MPSRRRRPPARTASPSGSAWRGAGSALRDRITAHVVGRDLGVCWICGHTGAKVGDHVIPVTERPDLALDAANIRASHGYRRSGDGACQTCTAAAGGKPIYCNELRGMGSVDRARRIIAERTGLVLGKQDQPRGERDW